MSGAGTPQPTRRQSHDPQPEPSPTNAQFKVRDKSVELGPKKIRGSRPVFALCT